MTVGSFLNVVIHRLPLISERDFNSEYEKYSYFEKQKKPRRSNDNKVIWFNKNKYGINQDRQSYVRKTSEGLINSNYNLLSPRSHCPSCHKYVRLIDIIPIFSYLILGGKCRNCANPISLRYPIVELISFIGTVYLISKFGIANELGTETGSIIKVSMLCVFFWACLALAFIDFYTKTLPDSITLKLLWVGILFSLSPFSNISLKSSVLGAAFGYFSLWIVYQAYRLLTGKAGMGYGDFKLLAAICAWSGIESLAPLLLFSSASGAIFGTALILLNKLNREQPMAFGPYLIISGYFFVLV